MRFQPGDFVEALETDSSVPGAEIRMRQIYVVARVAPEMFRHHPCSGCGGECRGDGVSLTEPVLPKHLLWCSSSFRLVYRPRQVELLVGLTLPHPAWQ